MLEHECQLMNIDLNGSDLGPGIENIPSWQECATLCTENDQCDSFTWNSGEESQCWLKRGVPKAIKNTERISGTASCFKPTSPGIDQFKL